VHELRKQKGENKLKPDCQTTRNKILAHLKEKPVFCLPFPVKPGPCPIQEIIVYCGKKDSQPEQQVETDTLRINILKKNFSTDIQGN